MRLSSASADCSVYCLLKRHRSQERCLFCGFETVLLHLNKKGVPAKAQQSGFRGERRRSGATAPCRMRRGKGCATCADERPPAALRSSASADCSVYCIRKAPSARMALFSALTGCSIVFSPPVSGYAAASPLVRWGLIKKTPPSDEGRLSPAGRDVAIGDREGGGGGKIADFDGGREPYRYPRRMWMAKPPYSPAR